MYELESIKETLTKIAALPKKSAAMRAEAVQQYDDPYPALTGMFSATVDTAAIEAQSGLTAVERAIASVAPMEQLSTLLYNAWDIDREEINLLEILTTKECYSYENGKLRTAVWQALREVQESEWENEVEGARQSLEAATFRFVQRDDFEGWERGDERVSFHMAYQDTRSRCILWAGYRFSYERDTLELCAGVSGEFGKLLETIKAGQPEPSTPCAEGSTASSSGEGS